MKKPDSLIMKKYAPPPNPYKNMTASQLRKERAKKVVEIMKAYTFTKDKKSFSTVEPTIKRLEEEKRLIESTLTNK